MCNVLSQDESSARGSSAQSRTCWNILKAAGWAWADGIALWVICCSASFAEWVLITRGSDSTSFHVIAPSAACGTKSLSLAFPNSISVSARGDRDDEPQPDVHSQSRPGTSAEWLLEWVMLTCPRARRDGGSKDRLRKTQKGAGCGWERRVCAMWQEEIGASSVTCCERFVVFNGENVPTHLLPIKLLLFTMVYFFCNIHVCPFCNYLFK